MSERLIFISCGQQTREEKSLGTAVKNAVNTTSGFKAYFAEYVQSLDALSENIFNGLRKCSGLIAFMHERGEVTNNEEEWGYRSSVWVNQELAILAYRNQFEGISIPVLAFKDQRVRLEGAMTSLIVNPKALGSEEEIVEDVREWLMNQEFSSASAVDERFLSKWEQLPQEIRRVVSAILDEGGENVKEGVAKKCLRDRYGFSKEAASKAVYDSHAWFMSTDLVKLIHNIHSGDEMTVNPTWKWHIVRQINTE